MIDHVSVAVRDLEASARFYTPVLAALGFTTLTSRPTTVGFGKSYPEFWLNCRPDTAITASDSGAHICLRAASREMVDAFFAAAMRAGGADDGAPGLRPEYSAGYYAAFVRDPDGNRVEAVTFIRSQPSTSA